MACPILIRLNLSLSHFCRVFLTASILFIFSQSSVAQNLEEIGISKGVKFNGSLNLSTVSYYANGINQRRDPFNWFVTGSLNVNLFGYSAPLSFSYSNANRSFSQPFNQFSFAPQYKWVKTYIGYSSMTFSSYTLAGHVFFGGGVELTPGKWRIAAMHGRLRKAVPFNLADTLQYTNASFRRMGSGLKIGYENDGDVISANIFAAKDDANSLPFILPQSALLPQQNVAVSISGRKKIFQRFFIDAEYAVSVLNRNTQANTNEEDSVAITSSNFIRKLLPENSTSRYFDAVNTSFGYQGNFYTLQVRYERVAPEYQTMGAYFFNNDMRNITFVPSLRLLKSKLNLSANVGLQKNNLDNTRGSTTERTVGSINANFTPNPHWNFAMSYSNFTSFTNNRPRSDPFFQNNLDTLNFYQVSQTMNGTVIKNLGSQEKPQSIMLTLSYQKANEQASYEKTGRGSDFINMNAAYNYSIVPSSTTFSIAANVYSNSVGGIKSTFWGPTVSLTKSFLQKTLRASWASTYNETSSEIKTSPILNNRLSFNFLPKAKGSQNQQHNFSLGLNVLNRLNDTPTQKSFSEFTGTLNYTYTL